MSKVVWVNLENMSFSNSVRHKLIKLLSESGATRTLAEGTRLALKVNTAEQNYEYGLRPGLLRFIATEAFNVTKRNPVICDGIKLVDYWNRSKGNTFLKVAGTWGYTAETLGGELVINGGFSGDEGDLFSCGTQSDLGGVEIGTAVCRSDALWVISHVTLHPLFGLNGALLNGGFECLSGRAKTRILNGTSPYPFNGSRPLDDEIQSFRKRALECSMSVDKALDGQVFYINFLWDVTPEPEYYPYCNRPIMENMGFLASNDPVALDSATVSIIEENNTALENLGKDFKTIIKEAEHLGIGKDEPSLVCMS